jgi:hypothetical protein
VSGPGPAPLPGAAPEHLRASGARRLDRGLLVVALVGAAVAVGLGGFGRLHHPAGVAVDLPGFSGPLPAKVWLTTLATVLAVLQLITALALYGRLPRLARPWTGRLHRWSGRLAFLVTVPVAMHCLYAFGFQTADPRVLLHSLLGCAFFGVFSAKMLSLSRPGLPGWLLPALGGSVFAALVGLWLSSALWFFSTVGIQW